MNFTRGGVYWVELPLVIGSHVQGGTRPCVVISDRLTNKKSSVVTVIPMSTKLDAFPSHPTVCVAGKLGQVLCDQLVTVDSKMIGDYCGTLSESEMDRVCTDVLRRLGLVVDETPELSALLDIKYMLGELINGKKSNT